MSKLTIDTVHDVHNGVMDAITEIEAMLRRNNGKSKSYLTINYFDLVRVRDHPRLGIPVLPQVFFELIIHYLLMICFRILKFEKC